VCATDGSKALEMLENREFKMVITDLNMPVISGLELAAKVRLQHAEIPVVLVTATEPAAIVAEAEEAGISCIISKPVNMRKFLTTIRSLLDHRSMQGNQEMECQP
jgi:CheY-like chemotaxis protein